MGAKRFKFIWGASKVIKGRWYLGLFGLYDREAGKREDGVAISGRGLLLWGAGALLTLYLAGGTALFFWFDRHPYNQVTFTDTMLLPVRWSRVQQLRGFAYLEEGVADLKAERWSEGEMKLRLGLARFPQGMRGRLALAQFYRLSNRRELALKLLNEGLAYGYPGRRYLEALFGTAGQGEDYDIILAACDRYLGSAAPPDADRDRHWLLQQKLQALLAVKRPAEVLAAIENERVVNGAMTKEMQAMALLELGRSADAVKFLTSWRASPGADLRQVLRLQVRALREAKQFDVMEAALQELRELTPADPRPFVYGVVQESLAGREAQAKAAMENYLLRFSARRDNLMLVCTPLAEISALPLLQRGIKEATAHGYPMTPFWVLLTQLQMQRGEWLAAQDTLGKIEAVPGHSDPMGEFWRDWMGRLVTAAASPTDSPQVVLLEMFQNRTLPIAVYKNTCEVLDRAGRFETERKVLATAERAYPASPTLAALRTRTDSKLAAAAAAAAKPGIILKEKAALTEKAFFQQLDEDMGAKRWTEAGQAVREVLINKPRWLDRREADVLSRQMRISEQLGDTLQLLGAAKIYLDGSQERSQSVLAFARELHGRGAQEDAELLVKEVLRKQPDFPPATRLLAGWKPKPKAPGK